MSKEPYVLFTLTIERTIDADGQLGFSMNTPNEFSFIEMLGLLSAAQWRLYHQMTRQYGGEIL
jgi:hypothetical protein